MKSDKLVSICIPTYNGEKHLKKTLESVLSQDYSNIEIIITDDISTDSTKDVIDGFNDPRIKYYKNPKNLGLGENWNNAVSKANGEFVKLLCQDDILFSGAISAQVNALQENPSATCCIGNTSVIDENDKEIMKRFRFKKSKLVNGKKFAKKSFRGRNIYAEPANLMYRRQYFDILGGYDTNFKYTIDWDFAIRVSCLGDIYCTDAPVMSFRVNSTSETSRLYSKKDKFLIKDTMKLIDKHIQLKELKLNIFNKIFFYLVTKSMMIVRGLVLKLHN